MSDISMDALHLVILAHALHEGTWAEVITAVVNLKGLDECETELAASRNTLEKWQRGSKLRPLTEKGLRKAIAEWVGLTTRLAPDRNWRCPACQCLTYADIHGSPGMVRCINCKREYDLNVLVHDDCPGCRVCDKGYYG